VHCLDSTCCLIIFSSCGFFFFFSSPHDENIMSTFATQGGCKECCNATCSENNAYCSTVKTYCSKYYSTCYTVILTFNNPRGVHFVTLSFWCSVWRRLNGWFWYRGCPQHVFRNKSAFISNVLGNSALCQLVGFLLTPHTVLSFLCDHHMWWHWAFTFVYSTLTVTVYSVTSVFQTYY